MKDIPSAPPKPPIVQTLESIIGQPLYPGSPRGIDPVANALRARHDPKRKDAWLAQYALSADGQQLRALNLMGCGLDDAKWQQIAALLDGAQLEGLNLRNNNLKASPLTNTMTQLRYLDLCGNDLQELELPTGSRVPEFVFLEGNKNLATPPPEIVGQGRFAIQRYLEALINEGKDQIYEAKLLLIGEGGAGKTSLCRKLINPEAELPQEKDRTRGIDIHPLYFNLPDKPGKQFRLNIWDFAGQGKYQSAHSFFYTHRSLYVLVDDTRTLNENEAYRTLYNNWLQTAELFGGQSPVLVLHNEKDGCTRTGFSLGSFQDYFGFVHGELFRVNLGGGDLGKLTKLKNRIQELAAELPHIGDTVPKSWVKVREAIEVERQKEPYISADRYRAICVAEGISDPDRQSDLSHYFHDLGVFLHFQGNPLLRHDVFLQNQWVTDAVYKILDDPQIAGEQRGHFGPSDLDRLWHESKYRARHDELLALMLQFELCYKVQDSDNYICPQLLPGDIPPYDLGTDIPLQLKYKYDFMPKGLLYRLMVRLHHYIAEGQTAVWNAGTVLERSGSRADVLESLDRRTISVRATGMRAKDLVTIINEQVELLHRPFGERLKVSVMIPCNCGACKQSPDPHFYDKKDLEDRVENFKNTVECKKTPYENVNVKGLLDGVFNTTVEGKIFRGNDSASAPARAAWTGVPRVFFSYSKADIEWLNALKKRLKVPVNNKKLQHWDDSRLLPGEEWDPAIKQALGEAEIILFLLSDDLLATDYVLDTELAEALRRHEAGEAIVVPIKIRPSMWLETPLRHLQALPRKDLIISTAPDRDAAWVEVVQELLRLIEAR